MRIRKQVAIVIVGAALTGGVAASPASAQQGEDQPEAIQLEEMKIEGEVAKPQVFYVLGRREVRYRSLELDRSFLDRIVKSVEDNPF